MKAEDILQKSAKKNMIKWNQESFLKTHPKLYKTIIEAINQALSIDNVINSHDKNYEEIKYNERKLRLHLFDKKKIDKLDKVYKKIRKETNL